MKLIKLLIIVAVAYTVAYTFAPEQYVPFYDQVESLVEDVQEIAGL